jgi:hypothetical protein
VTVPTEELKPIAVTSVDTPLSSALSPLRGESGVFRVPARGGARALISITWDPGSVGEIGAIVLYGIAGGARTPLAVAHFSSTFAGVTLPAFSVGGFPFEAYELDGVTTATGVTGGLKARAVGLVSASAGSEGEIVLLGVLRFPQSTTSVVPSSISAITSGWTDQLIHRGLTGYRCVAITTDDSTDLVRRPTDGLLVGVSGDVKITDAAGNTTIWPSLAAGIVHPINAVRIFSTDTTATGIRAIYGS